MLGSMDDVDDWIEGWVQDRLAQLTLDEKVSLLAGADAWRTPAIERVGVPAIKVTDGPNGARGDATTGATAACFPVGVALGATWNPELLEEVGAALAEETKSKGAQILLGPTVNIHRTPLAGRNFECYSEDPLLTAQLAIGFINGVQSQGVGACIKHFAGNESEFERMTISSEIPERALREIYLVPFEAAVAQAEPWAVMGAYNRVGGTYACAHHRLLVEILKEEWAFDGIVISDWGAVHDTVESANGGCDLEMPGPPKYFGETLVRAVASGAVDEKIIDDKARRMLRTIARSGRVHEPDEPEEQSVDRPKHRDLARRAAVESMVLLQNRAPRQKGDPTDEPPVLPLDLADPKALRTLAVIGPNAERGSIMGGGSSVVRSHHQSHPLAALTERLGDHARIVHAPGGSIDRFVPDPRPNWFAPLDDAGRGLRVDYLRTHDVSTVADQPDSATVLSSRLVRSVSWVWWAPPDFVAGESWGARWTASFVPDATGEWSFGISAIGRARVLVDGQVVADNFTRPRPGVLFFGAGTDEVVGSVALDSGTPHDLLIEFQPSTDAERHAIRFGIAPPVANDAVADAAQVAAAADAAVVIVGTNGDWETEGSDRASMSLPGRQDELIAAVVAANPRTVVVLNTGSPVEMPWIEDVPAVLQVWFPGQEFGDALADVLLGEAEPGGRLPTTFPRRYRDNPTLFNYPGENGQVLYGEGVFVGYRAYDTQALAPQFAFGHGLSYTTFAYEPAAIEWLSHDPLLLQVSAPLRNTGARAGHDVVQVYVSAIRPRLSRPVHELKGFAKVWLEPGEATSVKVTLPQRAFAAFDPGRDAWVVDPGDYEIVVGSSSRDHRDRLRLSIDAEIVIPIKQSPTK